MTKIEEIQTVLGVAADDIWGPKSEAALRALIRAHQGTGPDVPPISASNFVLASSFADPDDIEAFRRCKLAGKTDQECFKVGDNGIGFWGDDTTAGSGPSCALPPEDIIARWGSIGASHKKPVIVSCGPREVICLVKDTMPSREHIANGAGIDLNPDTCEALGLTPPIMVAVMWKWA